MKIIWSDTAKQDYWQNIDYILREWDEQVAIDFLEAVDNTTRLIADTPKIGVKTDYKGIRKIFVTKQISLFYRGNKKTIELIRFWNNYRNPESLKL